MKPQVLLRALMALAACITSGPLALANGAFPLSGQFLANPTDPDQLIMRGNFGLVVSRDGGASFSWLCETGMGYENIEPPMALLASGSILLAVPGGISRSDASWCDFTLASGITANVVDVSIERGTPQAALAVSYDLGTRSSELWSSSDDGQSFAPISTFDDFQITSVDVAASDSDRIYVSGRTVPGGAGSLLRSDDHGANWDAYDVPFLIPSQPYIAAVHPDDPDTVYVRRNGIPGTLWVTHNGGQSFEMILKLTGPLKAFALSPDGQELLAGSMGDGLLRADAESPVFERVACDGVQCLSWTDAGLFSCGDLIINRYMVGSSSDQGESFDTVLWPSCVPGPLECPDGTSIATCGDDWPMVQTQFHTSECSDAATLPANLACFATAGAGGATDSAGAAGAGGAAGSAGASDGGARASNRGAAGATSEPPAQGGSPAPDEDGFKPAGGGLCTLGLATRDAWPWALVALAAFSLRKRRHGRTS